MEKLKILHLVGETVNWGSHFVKYFVVLCKFNIIYESTIPLVIIPKRAVYVFTKKYKKLF